MIKNKKANEWFWLVTALIAIVFLVVTLVIVGKSLAGSKSNLDAYQNCDLRKGGHCEASETDCNKPGEIAYFRNLGCGDEKRKEKPYCCLPSPT